jgi:hypothetical protein
MADWRYAIGDHAVGPTYLLKNPYSPQLTFYLAGQPHEFTATIDGRTGPGLFVQEMVYDLWAWRDNTLAFRGPVTAAVHQGVGSDSHTIQLTANSYRARLARWLTPQPAAASTSNLVSLHSGTATITGWAWWAVLYNLAASDLATNPACQIVDKHATIGSAITQTAQGATAIDAVIDAFSTVTAFDWDMIPNPNGTIEFTTWASRGTAKPGSQFLVLDPNTLNAPGFGGNCTLGRTLDLGGFANVLLLNGTDATGNSVWVKASTPFGPEGLYMLGQDGTSIDPSQLTARANTLLTQAQTPTPAYTVTPEEGWWGGPTDVWLGDAPQLVIKDGALNVNQAYRVQQIVISPDGNGAENAQFTVGSPPLGKHGEFALARTLAGMARRIRNVEVRI